MGSIISMLIVGLIAGLIARAVLPGKDSMSWVQTMVLGVVGAFVGGGLRAIVTSRELLDFEMADLGWSIPGAIVALLVYRQIKARN